MNGLSKYYIKKLIKCFSDEMTATETSKKLKINRNTVNKYYRILREAIADYQVLQVQYYLSPLAGKQQRYCIGWHKNKGIQTELQDNEAVFALSVVNGKVYVEEVAASELQDTANPLLSVATITHMPLGTANLSLRVIDDFYGYAKEKLTRFYGVKEEYTFIYMKELEFRFNNKGKDLTMLVWKILPHHSDIWEKRTRRRRASNSNSEEE